MDSIIFAVLGSLGGIVAFFGGIWVVVKSVLRNVNAIELNTAAVRDLSGKIQKMEDLVDNHGERIAHLEGRYGPRSARAH